MMRKGKRKSANFCLAAGFILACCLAQTVDGSRLKKTERRGRSGADAAETIGVQEGKIIFGGRSGVESQVVDGTRKVSSNASVEDETAYQADQAHFPGWAKGQAYDAKEASWKRMAPSLHCSGDQMKFRALGPGASHFAVEQGNAPPMPLSQVPSSCGYTMQRNSLALVILVPYDGCNIVQEGGNYMLPMRWQGIPVSLSCPKPTASAAPHHPQEPQTSKIPGVSDPKIPPYSPYFPPFYHFFPPPLPVTTAAPTTAAPTTSAKPAAPPVFHFPFYPPFYPPFPWPFPTTTTTTTKPTPKPQLPQFPPYLPFPPFPPYPPMFPPYIPHYPTPKPETTTTPPTTTTTKKTDPLPTVVPPHDHPHYHPHEHIGFPFMPFPFPSG